MGLDIGALFGQAEDAAKAGMNDVLNQGGTAALGYLESQAVAVISADQKQNEAATQANVTALLNRPSSPGGIGSYLSSLVQGPALKQYGPYVLVAVAIVVVGTILLSRKNL